ncbi:hypothetical protein SALBM311S_11404 [Streptomyces alboniger]
MKRHRRRSALLAVAGLTGGLLLASPQPASAANLVKNPGFETAGTGDMPYCWEESGRGDNDFALLDRGRRPQRFQGHEGVAHPPRRRRPEGANHGIHRMRAGRDRRQAVRPRALVKSTTPDTSLTLFRHDATAGWQYLTDLKTLEMSSTWSQAAVRTPAVPVGTDRITWGVSVYGTGSVTADDYTMDQVADPVPPAACTSTAEECANGKWTVLPTKNPVRSMHSVVLNNGKVLLIAGSGNSEEQFNAGTFTSAVYDPVKGTYKVIPTPKDMFCSGHVQLQDGRVLVMSGNKAYPVAGGRRLRGLQGLVHLRPEDRDVQQDQRHERRPLVPVGDRARQR